ncbi:MAG: outer membrane protein assembly factor BamB [Gammaproteobacteria bacterium]|nr:outer membrane protein assembly factor BamB [Gammaproteobacteria bacterium]MCF6261534.1 outer membrane protein assembly factor BamB [Gammaproteobacteria bacterium]
MMLLRMKKIGLMLVALISSLLLVACGSSPKDYSDATPLNAINTSVSVKALWAKPTGDVPEYAHAQLPVVIDMDVEANKDKKIYVASRRGEVAAHATKNGDVLWQISMNEALTGGPGVGAGLLFVGTREAELVALDKNNGAERWRQRISSEMLATPVVAGEFLVVQTIDGRISVHKTTTGKKLWSYERSIPKLTLRGTSVPLVVNEAVLAGFSDGRLLSLSLATGELLWETTIAVPHGRTDLERLVDIDGLFRAADGVVYVSSYQGRVAAVSIEDGNVLWARDMSSYTGLTVSEEQIFITDATSRVWALDGRTGATLWRQDSLLGRELSVPVVQGNTLVVADYDGFVHWLSQDDGGFVARKSLDKVWSTLRYIWDSDESAEKVYRSVSVSPLVDAGTLYVRDNTGALAAFALLKQATPKQAAIK